MRVRLREPCLDEVKPLLWYEGCEGDRPRVRVRVRVRIRVRVRVRVGVRVRVWVWVWVGPWCRWVQLVDPH